jgi:hypothetical protein
MTLVLVDCHKGNVVGFGLLDFYYKNMEHIILEVKNTGFFEYY